MSESKHDGGNDAGDYRKKLGCVPSCDAEDNQPDDGAAQSGGLPAWVELAANFVAHCLSMKQQLAAMNTARANSGDGWMGAPQVDFDDSECLLYNTSINAVCFWINAHLEEFRSQRRGR